MLIAGKTQENNDLALGATGRLAQKSQRNVTNLLSLSRNQHGLKIDSDLLLYCQV